MTKNNTFRCKIVLLNNIVLLVYTFIQSKIKDIQNLFGGKYHIIPSYYIPIVGIRLTTITDLKTFLVIFR